LTFQRGEFSKAQKEKSQSLPTGFFQ